MKIIASQLEFDLDQSYSRDLKSFITTINHDCEFALTQLVNQECLIKNLLKTRIENTD